MTVTHDAFDLTIRGPGPSLPVQDPDFSTPLYRVLALPPSV